VIREVWSADGFSEKNLVVVVDVEQVLQHQAIFVGYNVGAADLAAVGLRDGDLPQDVVGIYDFPCAAV
jgi:hypothetical protein